MAIEARPVRMVASSRRTVSTEESMRVLASASICLMVVAMSLLLLDHGPDALAQHDLPEVALLLEVVDDDREPVVHAEGDGGGVHHLEALLQHVEVTELRELLGGG